jgi:hypothetical protein
LNPSLDGDDGTDTLTAVEHLQFADRVVTIGDKLALTVDPGDRHPWGGSVRSFRVVREFGRRREP